jgi:hypothetical protein
MAPAKKNAPTKPAGITPVAAAVAMTTAHGYAIQIMGFVPIPRDDLRKQAEIPLLILDIQEGRKPLSELVPHLKGLEFRHNYLGRRITVDEAAAWRGEPRQMDIEDIEQGDGATVRDANGNLVDDGDGNDGEDD